MKSLGVQLYSLRDEFAADPEAALRRVPGLGFSVVELAGTYGWAAAKWNRMLAETGLSVGSAHVPVEALEGDFEGTVTFYREIGCPTLIVPFLPPEAFGIEALEGTAARLSTLANRVQGAGFLFAYHNHAHEIAPLPTGEIPLAALARHLGDQRVSFQLDTYWVEKAGQSTLGIIDLLEPQISHIHAKELRKSDGADVPAGQGDVPFPEVLRKARAHNWPVVVEFEGTDAMAAVAESARYLRDL
ncbi:MAG: sugar phosphate isomerase/epimerase [Opitutales bacterium]|nr:sugar phosphate isomerase/epimerase [Opitutales bacterium]